MPTPLKHSADFERFYLAYPRKVAKEQARKNFAALTRLSTPDQVVELVAVMILGIDKHKKARAKMEQKNGWVADWPHPATFISQRRWEDEFDDLDPVVKDKGTPQCFCGSVTNLHTFNGGYRCHACYLKQTDLDILRDKFREKGLSRKPDESHEDWIRRLIETQKREIGRLLKPFARKQAQTKRLGNCWHCKGEGRYREMDETISDKKPAQWVVCPKCGGDGGKIVEREPGEDG